MKRRSERKGRSERNEKKPELNPARNHLYVTGLVAKEPKARKRDGLIVTPPTEMVAINLVADQEKRSVRSIQHVAQHLVHVKREVEAALGVKNQKNEEKRNELNTSKT